MKLARILVLTAHSPLTGRVEPGFTSGTFGVIGGSGSSGVRKDLM